MDTIITGKVIKGDQYGRKLGFPTANLDRREYNRKGMKIKFGVYAGTSSTGHKAAIVIGPMDKKGLPKLEAHLLGFEGNLYGKKMSLTLIKYIRPFKKYKTEGELKKAIAADIKAIK
jgi:riboflavin kinase/FMN adenylyltransferase